jgi:membrane protein implicated in regulation of membrane protease activity
MIEKHRRRWHSLVTGTLVSVGLIFAGGVLLHWSWNAFAAGLLQAPAMEFRHAVAAEVLLGVVIAIAAISARFCARVDRGSTLHANP